MLQDLPTPCLILDEARMLANIARFDAQAARLGVATRPHLKTAKCMEVARLMTAGGTAPVTVSTLEEARRFGAAGFGDILYAVGIAPQKLAEAAALRRAGCDLVVILDSVQQAEAAAAAGVPAMIEIDSDGHRGGLAPGASEIVEVGASLARAGLLRGVMTHAGESYAEKGEAGQARHAELERRAVVVAAEALRAARLDCAAVSVGSTPTAHGARDLEGVTEVRAGVYVFFDLVMAGIEVCTLDDIALSVLATVIGHRPDKGWILVDAGWMALSRDRGTAAQAVDQGYGVVCDAAGRVLPDLIVGATSQEHGILHRRAGSSAPLPELAVGARVRILPNHACATAAQHDRYHVIRADGQGFAEWHRFGGW